MEQLERGLEECVLGITISTISMYNIYNIYNVYNIYNISAPSDLVARVVADVVVFVLLEQVASLHRVAVSQDPLQQAVARARVLDG